MPARRPSPPAWSPTPRQRLVLSAVVLYGRKEAAERLGIAEKTVDHTIDAMRRGAEVPTIEQLIYVATAAGFVIIPELAKGRSHVRWNRDISPLASGG